MKPLVSVFVIAYRHERFIGQAIESIVNQKTDFSFEIVIGEDCSPDNTRAICEEYAARYPDIIHLLPSERNLGPIGNGIRTLRACRGTYIAMCEGDDYWLDMHKLQKQVGFLEANPEFSICFSEVQIQDEMGWDWKDTNYFPKPTKDVYTIDDLILAEQNIIPTPTMVFRNVLPQPYPDFFVNALVGDIAIQLFAADKGKAKFLPEKLAVYRNHAGGITKSKENQEKGEAALLSVLHSLNEFFGFRYNRTFRQRFFSMARVNMVYGSQGLKGMAKFRNYKRYFREYLRYTDKLNLKEIVYYHIALFLPGLLRFYSKSKTGSTS